ncbi:MAG: hypothetical protein COA79_01550 [Planctomycetota bacterium]|nr:MAG: hypothetical protein COA79_01550 [Planctomycetota bacterium]
MSKDLRNKVSVFPINAVHSYFKIMIYGDDIKAIKKQSLLFIISSIDFEIHLTNTEEIPSQLNEFQKNIFISPNVCINTFNPFHFIFLAINKTDKTKEILDMLLNESKMVGILNHYKIHGNITLPSSFKKDDVEVSIHSNGRTNRRARTLSNCLKRHTELFFNTTLVVIGTDHNYLNLEDREPYHLNELQNEIIDEELSLVAGLQEYFILNTCNRIEIYAICNQSPTVIGLIKKIINFDHLNSDNYYIKYDKEAFTHLTMVMSGLYSQIPGESHVVKQLKDALNKSQKSKHANGLLQQLFDNSLFISKKVREKTCAHTAHFEIEDVAIHYGHDEINQITNKTIMIIGTGIVAKGLLDRIMLHTPRKVIICYRNNKLDVEKFNGYNITHINVDDIENGLQQADLVFSAVSTDRFVVHSKHIKAIKNSSPVYFIDICVPRSIDSYVMEKANNIKIVDIETLKSWHLNSFHDMNNIKQIGLEEINKKLGRYEKVFDKEWLQEQPTLINSNK